MSSSVFRRAAKRAIDGDVDVPESETATAVTLGEIIAVADAAAAYDAVVAEDKANEVPVSVAEKDTKEKTGPKSKKPKTVPTVDDSVVPVTADVAAAAATAVDVDVDIDVVDGPKKKRAARKPKTDKSDKSDKSETKKKAPVSTFAHTSFHDDLRKQVKSLSTDTRQFTLTPSAANATNDALVTIMSKVAESLHALRETDIIGSMLDAKTIALLAMHLFGTDEEYAKNIVKRMSNALKREAKALREEEKVKAAVEAALAAAKSGEEVVAVETEA